MNMGSMKLHHVFIVITIWLIMADLVASNVVLMGKNITLTFDDVEANFAPPIKGSGICGTIYVSDPLDACNPLTNKAPESQFSPFALIIRGNCTFDEKVRNAQNAGYKAAIVYDNEDYNPLVSMAGSSTGIHIYAVFISHESGQTLTRYAGRTDIETWLIPTFSNSAWSIVAISFISLLAMSAVLATCFFVRRHRVRRERPPLPEERDRDCMTSQLVNKMPAVLFTNNNEQEQYCTGFTCAICLEDYSIGDRLRVLPCRHKFHVMCVDMWLTSWRTFCPVCKRDARANSSFHTPPPSETTPLLSSSNSLLSNSPSIHSSLPPRSHSRVYTQNPNHQHHHNNNNNRINGLSSSYSNNNSRRHSPPISIGRSSTYADFRVVSSSHSYRGAVMTPSSSPQRRYGSHLTTSSSPLHQYGSYTYTVTSPSPYRYGSHMMTSPSPHHQNGSHVMTSSPLYQYGSQVMVPSSSLRGAQMMISSLPYRYGSPYNGLGSSVESSGYNLGSSDRQSYLRHCEESGASLSEMASAQSLPDC